MAIVRKGLSTTMGRDVEGEQRRASAKKKGRGDLHKPNIMICSLIDLIFVFTRAVSWVIFCSLSAAPKKITDSHCDHHLNQ